MTLRAIFFDVDDTLYSTTEFAERARHAAVDAMIEHGLQRPRDVVYRELMEVVREFSSNNDRHYDHLLQRLGAAAYPGVNPAVIIAAGIYGYHEVKTRALSPFTDAMEVLRRLHATSLKIGIISEGLQIKQAEKLVRLKILPMLNPEAIFITDQIGISKVNPKIYERVASEMGFAADEILMVGDNPRSDVDSPAEAGWKTCLCRRGGKYSEIEPEFEPTYEVRHLWELEDLLRQDFPDIVTSAANTPASGVRRSGETTRRRTGSIRVQPAPE